MIPVLPGCALQTALARQTHHVIRNEPRGLQHHARPNQRRYIQNRSLANLGKKFDFNFIKQEYGDIFLKIFTSNTLMLIFGFLNEINFLNKYISLTFGVFFFTLSFKYIFDNFIQYNYINYITLSIFIFIWLLYAVAFLFDFHTKNIAYNLLDLISKNCFGIFLFFYLYYLNSL